MNITSIQHNKFFTLIELLIVTPSKKIRSLFGLSKSALSADEQTSFTLIELLIVIGILAILTAAVVVVLNPAELLKQARDSQRMQDLTSLDATLNTIQALNPDISFGTASTVYISIPDTSSTCANLDMPSLPSGWAYHCVTEANLHNTDASGWIPVNFQDATVVTSIQLSSLPIDPTNTTSTGLYYTYITGGSYELAAMMESEKYATTAAHDGGSDALLYEKGTDLTLTPNISRTWACGDTLTDSRNSNSYTTVLIGTQCWMAQNLNIGTMVLATANQADNGTIEKYCYSDTESNCTSNGGFYQWDEAMQYASSCNGTGSSNPACSSPVQGVCPSGWHIPSHYEWTALERSVCTSGTCATDFQYDTTTTGWRGTNEGTKLAVGGSSGFEAAYVGNRTHNGAGYFDHLNINVYFWSSLESGSSAWVRFVGTGTASVYRIAYSKLDGYSIRCVKD
jgi:uncharacterized protein (TIGR02145 family)